MNVFEMNVLAMHGQQTRKVQIMGLWMVVGGGFWGFLAGFQKVYDNFGQI